MTILLRKHWEWHEDRTPMLRHCSVVPTMYLASMDTKTAFDEARPRHVEKYGKPKHPWMDYFSPLARDGWSRRPGCVRMRGEQFLLQSTSSPRKRRSSQMAAKDGHAAPGKCGGELNKEKNGYPPKLGRAKFTGLCPTPKVT